MCIRCARPHRKSGFTLLELVVALSLLMLLTIGAAQLLQQGTAVSTQLLDRQEAMEQARTALDSLVIHLQLADQIQTFQTQPSGRLTILTTRQINPSGVPWPFSFTLGYDAGTSAYRLNADGGQMRAQFLDEVQLVRDGDLIFVTVTASLNQSGPVTLTGVVDMRYR